jgi:hypothetical protein
MEQRSDITTLIDINEPAPPPVTTALDEDVELTALKRERRRMDGIVRFNIAVEINWLMSFTDIDLRVVRKCVAPELTPRVVFNTLLSLNSASAPGIKSAVFERLFARCQQCDLVMTRRIFQLHDCVVDETDEPEVVDFTMQQ